SRGAAGARTHRGAPLGIPGELHAGLPLDERQHFALDELRIGARYRVVFEPTLRALGILSAIADVDGNHRWHAALLDQVVEDRVHILPCRRAAVADHDERYFAAAHIVRRDVDVDRARPDTRMAGG